MSAFTPGRSGSAAGRDARSLAGRGASSGSTGSGAPSHRARATLLALAASAALLLALAPVASAGKIVDRIVSGTTSTGTTGGLFSTPRGLAVNHANVNDGSGTDGWLYVVDDNNHRVQAFNAAGEFKFAIGRDVIASGKPGDLGTAVMEKCTVAADCKAGSFGTTADGPTGEFDNPQGIAIDQASGDLYVRDRDNRRVQQFEADGTFVRMWGHDVITAGKPNDNGTGFEICDVTNGNEAADCKVGTTGAAGGQFATSSTASTGIAVVPAGAPNAGNVIVADPTNRRVQEFGPAGAWVRAWGWDVVVPGGTGEQTVGPLNEQQRVTLSPPLFGSITGGTFTLTFGGNTTAPIAHNADSAAVQAALEALPGIGSGNVAVSGTGNPWTVEFVGVFAGTDVAQMTGDPSGLTASGGAATISITTPVSGGFSPGFESCTVLTECKAAAESVPAGESGAFGTNNPTHLAIDAGGVVYAADSVDSNRVQRFDSTDATPADLRQSALAVSSLTGTSSTATTGLDVDPSNGHLYVARSSAIGILELANPSGGAAEADRHYEAAALTANAIAIDGTGDDLYMSSTTSGHRVVAADDDGSPPAAVSVELPTDIEAHSATLTGSVNPEGSLAVSYTFQYSRNGVTWTNAAPLVDIGIGTSPIAVADNVTGLEANAFYRVRLVTKKPFGNPETISPEVVFLTDSIAPEMETLYPRQITPTGVTLVGRVNPNNLITNYHFDHGLTVGYGGKAPVPDATVSGGQPQEVTQRIGGLEPGTTYHFRVAASNAEGAGAGSDVSFTTREAADEVERAYEMVTPPFKVVRSAGATAGGPRNNPRIGVPSLGGESIAWGTAFFPLTEDVGAPGDGDRRIIRRTANGWVHSTRNTLKALGKGDSTIPPGFWRQQADASSGDLESLLWRNPAGIGKEMIPSEGNIPNRHYTRRDGTGVEGFTPWLSNPEQQIGKMGFATNGPLDVQADQGVFNDDGTAMARWGWYRMLAENGATSRDDDPSDEQQLRGTGETIYLQQADDPADLPVAPKDLVNECTGQPGGSGDPVEIPTEIPARIGSGASSDTIGTQQCTAQGDEPVATGAGTVNGASNVITSVTTDTGAFAVGQFISGPGTIPGGTTITAVGAGTLTMSANALPTSIGKGTIENGSNQITSFNTSQGSFEVGQTIVITPDGGSIQGPPREAEITAIDGDIFTLSATISGLFFSPYSADVTFAGTTTGPLAAETLHVTSPRGATVGGNSLSSSFPGAKAVNGPVSTAMSDDGRRVFFQSPSAQATGVATTACATATGLGTSCPPQLFVRQYDEDGENPVVRWISRAQGIGSQQIGLIGAGAGFQGASRDGRYVYFKTNAPLLPDDPNAGSSITTGTAQATSWDLYRYELPESLDDDPAAGTLFRVSGGPTGAADPSTNPGGGSSSSGSGGTLRFLSDDGERAYFVTTSPIVGADADSPEGGSTAPGGEVATSANDGSVRNLYLFDGNETGADRWKFIARIPFHTGGSDANAANGCASYSTVLGYPLDSGGQQARSAREANCFRGVRDGGAVIFITRGRLTTDDQDNAYDIYLYDAERDELVRVSAPHHAEVAPYSCIQSLGGASTASCYGDFGASGGWGGDSDAGGLDHHRGWGGGRYHNIARDESGIVSVFFESQSQLVPEDTNGDYTDVYEWRQGELSLVTPGNTDDDAWYSGSSVDGSSVFFFTSQRIDPREIDAQDLDIYVARVGGGFPYTPPPTPCNVLAFECEAAALAAAPVRAAATPGFAGSGNVNQSRSRPRRGKCSKGKVRRKGKCVRKRSNRRGAGKTRRASR